MLCKWRKISVPRIDQGNQWVCLLNYKQQCNARSSFSANCALQCLQDYINKSPRPPCANMKSKVHVEFVKQKKDKRVVHQIVVLKKIGCKNQR